ncbi:MAG: hypothetical protein ONB44_22505 [candidate division KSB1 bacterium]|nr:hypothetical protein [candidate division KSB1 bacterium]MDZ7304910.1 hypothetical protein [candidate division KSB1 bacterium]MDZ7313954.1 hypothetical protein [candidate division KSB1 bacterium]
MQKGILLNLAGIFVVALAMIGLLAACGHKADMAVTPQPPQPGATVSTFTDIQNKIFTPNCAFSGCHGAQNTQPLGKPMNLSAGNAYDNIVNVASLGRPTLMRVKPNEPDNSYLIHKLEGRSNIAGARMPSGGSALSTANIQMVKDWIAGGAKNN